MRWIFLNKSVLCRSLTQLLQPFLIWIRICGDIRHRKSSPRYQRCRELTTSRIDDRESRKGSVNGVKGPS